MKQATSVLLAVFAVFLFAGLLPAQKTDLSGTWVGDTMVPNSQDKDGLTLVLRKTENSYAGTISDSMGMLSAVALENVKFENGTLTFQFTATVGDQNIKVITTLKVNGEKLSGSWSDEQGDTGALEMTLKK